MLGSGEFGQTFLAEDIQMPSRRICVVKQQKELIPEIIAQFQQRLQSKEKVKS